jgi:glyceraldehyde-3-phosphate dehydrogenase/erythrose-4-phosphate dehydrogenase
MDLVVQLANDVTAEQVNEVLQQASDNGMQGVLGYCDEPLASCDFNHDPRSSIIDAAQTAVSEKRLLKLFTWFDNEWGFANRMLDTAGLMLRA